MNLHRLLIQNNDACLTGSFDSRSYYSFQLLDCATYALDRNPKTFNANALALWTAQYG